MKKVIAFLMALCMALSISACGKPADKPADTDSTGSEKDTIVSSENTGTEEEPNKYTEVTVVPGKDIFVNYLSTRRCSVRTNNNLIYNDERVLISVVHDAHNEYSDTIEGIVDFLDEKFLGAIHSYSDYSVGDSHIEVESQEKTTVNGFDSVKFVGKVPVGEKTRLHVYGYSFIIDGTPCMVVGLLSVGTPEQSQIDELNTEIDEMVKTIRTKR